MDNLPLIIVNTSKNGTEPKKPWHETLNEEQLNRCKYIKSVLRPGTYPIWETAADEIYVDVDKEGDRSRYKTYRTVIDDSIGILTDGVIASDTNKDSSGGAQKCIQITNYNYVILQYKNGDKIFKESVHMVNYAESLYLKTLVQSL